MSEATVYQLPEKKNLGPLHYAHTRIPGNLVLERRERRKHSTGSTTPVSPWGSSPTSFLFYFDGSTQCSLTLLR